MIDQRILFPYAYNILGSAEDAKDVIQDVLSNYVAHDRADVGDEKNYLIQSVINRAINAKKRKRKIIGQSEVWLPEPVATDDAADRNLYLKDILSYSLLVLLEKLHATERAVFILKESFDYSHQEIARVLSITEEHSRKLLSRAKAKLFKPGPGTVDRDAQTSRLLERYMDAIQRRDVPQLESLLSADIAYYADGGARLHVVKKECVGAHDVAELAMLAYYRFLQRLTMRLIWVNYQPALVYYDGDRLAVCQVFEFDSEGKIMQINTIVDPEKLRNDLHVEL
ncbi:MAG TPA: sigma-70 family RNA polymerase sigma factor [Puia sp.]|nr:sigma-70 family RNA polymerase sigma factor [Puia sp.]